MGSLRRLIMQAFLVTGLIVILQGVGHSQNQIPPIGPVLRPLVKLVGFVNATIPESNLRPVVSLQLPGDEKRYLFLVTEIKVMAGPLRTAESILAEVRPSSPNFRIRTTPAISTQIASASPIEQLTILAEYAQVDRSLFVMSFEKQEAQ